MPRRWSLFGTIAFVACAGSPASSPQRPPPAGSQTAREPALARLQREADALGAIVESPLARSFLGAVRDLPVPSPRAVLCDAGKAHCYSAAEAEALRSDERDALRPVDSSATFY